MDNTKKLWTILIAMLVGSFAVLLWSGGQIYQAAPPVPEEVVTTEGETVFTRDDIELGRRVWQSAGGMQLGSIWGHGGYVAPDWTADWLHREAIATLDIWARRDYVVEGYADLPAPQQAALQARLEERIRRNTWNAERGSITIDADRAAAIATVSQHYDSLFANEPETAWLREAYAMKNDTVPDADHRRALSAFYWWTAWAAVTERPGKDITYTSNWPAEELVGNVPPANAYVWTVFSVLFLIAGIALLGWYYAVTHGKEERVDKLPDSDPLAMVK